jgi:hypothetical protein
MISCQNLCIEIKPLVLDILGQPEAAGVPSDFRFHVWLAYGLVLLLLATFTFWTVGQIRAVARKVDHLKDVVGKTDPDAK